MYCRRLFKTMYKYSLYFFFLRFYIYFLNNKTPNFLGIKKRYYLFFFLCWWRDFTNQKRIIKTIFFFVFIVYLFWPFSIVSKLIYYDPIISVLPDFFVYILFLLYYFFHSDLSVVSWSFFISNANYTWCVMEF